MYNYVHLVSLYKRHFCWMTYISRAAMSNWGNPPGNTAWGAPTGPQTQLSLYWRVGKFYIAVLGPLKPLGTPEYTIVYKCKFSWIGRAKVRAKADIHITFKLLSYHKHPINWCTQNMFIVLW